MATITKTRGRKPLADGPLSCGWSRTDDTESFTFRTLMDRDVWTWMALTVTREEAQRMADLFAEHGIVAGKR